MSEPRTDAQYTLIRAGRLLDGLGGPPLEDAAVLLRNGVVERTGPAAEVRAPDGAPVSERDYGDATIVPGLVDAHTHLVAPGDGTPGDDFFFVFDLLRGDIDGDGDVDDDDLNALVAVLLDTPFNSEHIARADQNGDGASNGRDIQPFIDTFVGGS